MICGLRTGSQAASDSLMAWLMRGLILLLRTGLWLCSLLLVLLALYVSLGRELMPLLAEYRVEVEREAGKAVGLPLRIGRLEGSWRDFGPLLVAHDVELGEGSTRVHLQTLRVKPDVITGLLERRLEISRIELEGLQLVIAQSAEGRWSVAGLPQSSATNAAVDPQQALGALLGISQLLLLDSQLIVQPFAKPATTFTYVELELRNGRKQRVDGRLRLPDGLPVSFSLRGKLNPADWQSSPAQLYLSLPQGNWAGRLPPELLSGWQVDRLQAGGELWAVAEEGQLQRLVARVNAPEISAAAAARQPVRLQDLALTAYLDRHAQGFDLRLESLALSLGEQRVGPLQLDLQRRQPTAEAAPGWLVRADRLDLAPLARLALSLAPASAALDEWLVGLQPHGQLSNIQASLDTALSTPDRLQFAANLSAVGVSAHANVPGLDNVSGSIRGDLGQGTLDLDAKDFVLDLAGIFPAPWQYFKAGARLAWTLDDQAFTLSSPYIRLDGEEGRIAGDLKIDIPFAADQYSTMDLRVGLTEGNAAYTVKYLPVPSADFSAGLADWLKTAIVAGDIDEGLFQYQGTLSASAPPTSSTLSLYFRLQDLELAYQPGWPALRQASGEVFVGETGVQVNVSAGQVLDSQVSQVVASVPPAAHGQAPRLLLSADLQSSVQDGLAILQTAPLGTAATFAGWQGSGDLSGKLVLDIPLDGPAPPKVVVDFVADGAQLNIPSPALSLSQIKAAFRYDSVRGLSTPSLRAQAFKQSVTGKIFAEGTPARSRTRIDVSSRIAITELGNWLGLPAQPLPVAGVLPYRLELILAAESQLRVDSSLQGVSLDLPAPFGKAANVSRAMQLRMPLAAREPLYRVTYGQLASLALAMPGGQLNAARGELVLGGQAAQLPDKPGLTLRGSVAELDVSAWQALVARYAGSGPPLNKELLRSASLQVGSFRGFGLDVSNLGISLARQGAAWLVGLDSTVVQGNVSFPDQAGLPIALNFTRVALPEPARTDAEALARPDPLAAIAPSSLPPLDVKVGQILLGSEPLGASSFKLRPVSGGVQVSELNLNLKGLLVTGNAGWTGPAGATTSWYKGRLQGADIGAVLQAWNYAPSVTSKRFRVDADVRWPGSPAWISLARLSGTLDGSMHDGSFTEVQGGGSNALRVFGLLNFSAIGRRLRLDFSDLFGKGMAYDRVGVLLAGTNGVFVTREPLDIKGPSAKLQLNGTLDMLNQSIDAKLFVTLPVSNTVALGALLAGAPVLAGAIFVVDKVADRMFGASTSSLAKVQYQIIGPMADPKITFFKP